MARCSLDEKAAADRYAFFGGFFQNFYNTDQFLGESVSANRQFRGQLEHRGGCPATASLGCVSAWQRRLPRGSERTYVPLRQIQGDADRILPMEATGRRTAKLIKGA